MQSCNQVFACFEVNFVFFFEYNGLLILLFVHIICESFGSWRSSHSTWTIKLMGLCTHLSHHSSGNDYRSGNLTALVVKTFTLFVENLNSLYFVYLMVVTTDFSIG